jgi:hypothetical protein
MLNEQQRKLIVTNMAQRLVDFEMRNLCSLMITAYNEYADAHPAEGLVRVDDVTPGERQEMVISALRVALMDMESRR